MNKFKQNLLIKNRNSLILIILLNIALVQNSFSQNLKKEEIDNPAQGAVYLEEKADSIKFYNIATVQILNKTTAKNSMVDLRIAQKVNLGAITLKAHKCWTAPLDQKPETKILIEVFENKNSQNFNQNIDETNENQSSSPESKRIFYGWLFASSPSISGLEHPIYDIISIACKK
jgi:hypothetical protein